MDIVAREVLSAPTSLAETRTLNIVILGVSLISALGAAWIVLSFILFRSLRSFRHQLILGLAISDFWMAINFMSSTAVNLSGHLISEPPQKAFCSFNGFMTQLFVTQTDYWVLTIAVCTFLVLASYKRQSSWIQEHRIVLWCLPWGFSTLCAALGLGFAGYGNIGAWCWFTSDRTRLLVNFIPRWIIIIAILAIYLRLYMIIYKAHNSFVSFDQDGRSNTHSLSPENESVSSTSRIGRPYNTLELHSKEDGVPDGSKSTSRAKRPRHTRGTNPVLKNLAYQMMIYPLVYMLIWTIPTCIRIYQSVTNKPAPFGIATVDKACIVVQGFGDALIYGFNESSKGVWRERFTRRRNNSNAIPVS
ncbi:hypothetical protein K432DRAFT_406116 [Lepidopterella palustris CBS 459.81]|uniref:G-protein coupled receptors family 2 profile 2 domain-containing protein n=1 Tax=Lepidopterella palustris CBS 459.81 TaxID=1314670 RepID=A0A8E2JDW6_9PEZI|nr:hypothetical protein K432DRAFT_406116 [Lepidopterella palustris CBS 459.81]